MSAVLVEFPSEIIEEIDKIAGAGNHSLYLLDLAKRQILQHQQIEAIRAATGTWKDEDHPELASMGSYEFVRKLRAIESKRFNPLLHLDE